LILDVEGERRICAADIELSTDCEIANPELYLATLDSPEAKLRVEFDMELGEGYQQAESRDDLPIGTIPVDAIFTPIRRVNFSVEPTHVGQETSRERLNLEVWTDGTVSPVDAVSRGATILVEQLAPFVNCTQVVEEEVEEKRIRSAISEELYNMPVDKLDLSVRTMNCLRRSGIDTVGQIISKGEKGLMALRNFGQKSKQEIDERLATLGLSFASPSEEDSDTPVEEGMEHEA
jgi:DNA-directed RNA polymerase subunit alpha